MFYGKLIKTFKKSCFHHLTLYFLTRVKTRVNDIGVYFIEYVFECYFLWNNSSYVFWDFRVWTSSRPKLDSSF